eukprot:4546286-Ditylum_brightwellii.AAC.1
MVQGGRWRTLGRYSSKESYRFTNQEVYQQSDRISHHSAEEEGNDNAGAGFALDGTPAFYQSARSSPFAVEMAQLSFKIGEGYSSCLDLQDGALTAALARTADKPITKGKEESEGIKAECKVSMKQT